MSASTALAPAAGAPTAPILQSRKRRRSSSARAAWIVTGVFLAIAAALVVLALLNPT